MAKQRELQDRAVHSENRLNEINNRIRQYESDDKSNSLRKEYLNLEKSLRNLKKDADALHEELEISNLDPKEAHAKFTARVNDFKQRTKMTEEKIVQLREDISSTKKSIQDLDNISNVPEDDNGEQAKYELLVKRDQDMTQFMDSFPETRSQILHDQQAAQYMIVALLEHIGKGLEDSNNIPSQDMHEEMENAKTFKEKNLATAQKTMESLKIEKKKREKEWELLKSSEPKLKSELTNLRESIIRMKSEMEEFKDIDGLRRAFDNTQVQLQELKQSYIKRKESMKQQVNSISADHEALKKTLNASDIARDIDDTEKRLKHFERSIFELKEYIDSKSREIDYDVIKTNCMRLVNTINSNNIRNNQQVSSNKQMYGAQSKGGW